MSDSNLSSDDQIHPQKSDHKCSESEDYSYSDDETVNESATSRHFLPGPNGFKISGQKIQIYSDGSVTATDAGNIRAYSLTDTEEEIESDKESEYSNYDADCSVLESPRISLKIQPEPVPEVPVKPPRRRSSEKDAARIGEDIERLQLQENLLDTTKVTSHSQKSSPSSDDMKTFPRSRISAARHHHHHHLHDGEKIYRKSSADSLTSAASRSKSFNGSRESLNLFGSVDFKNLGISKNFSSDVIREVYGSKTSLLKHLDQERKLRQLELNLEDDPSGSQRRRETLVHDLLSKSTDSILTSSRIPSGDKSSLFASHQTGTHYKLRILFSREKSSDIECVV